MELAGNIVHCRVAKMKPASTGLRLIGRDALSECEPLHTNEFGACRIACRCWSLVNFVVPRVRRWVYLQQRFAGHRACAARDHAVAPPTILAVSRQPNITRIRLITQIRPGALWAGL